MITKDQIEAAADDIADRWQNSTQYIQLRDLTIHELIEIGAKDGALWMQAQLEGSILRLERAAWDAAREPRKWTQVFGPQSHIPEGQKYETFEDWKQEKK